MDSALLSSTDKVDSENLLGPIRIDLPKSFNLMLQCDLFFWCEKFALLVWQCPWSTLPSRVHPKGIFTGMGSSCRPWRNSRWINKWAMSAPNMRITTWWPWGPHQISDSPAGRPFSSRPWNMEWLVCRWPKLHVPGSGWSLDEGLKLTLSKFWAVALLPTVLMLRQYVSPISCMGWAKSFLIRVESLPESRTAYIYSSLGFLDYECELGGVITGLAGWWAVN